MKEQPADKPTRLSPNEVAPPVNPSFGTYDNDKDRKRRFEWYLHALSASKHTTAEYEKDDQHESQREDNNDTKLNEQVPPPYVRCGEIKLVSL